MCSLGDDQIENEPEPELAQEKLSPLDISGSECKKCREQQPKVVLRGRDTYCRACFLQGVLHKFKGMLGKHRFLSHGDRVLVVHQSGHPSTALLHFLRTGLSSAAPKKILIEPVILFIECQFDLGVDERRQILKEVDAHIKSFSFALRFASLMKYILKEDYLVDDFNDVQLDDDDGNRITRILSLQASQTVKEEVSKIFTRRLIIDVAKQLKCKCIFMPELAVDVASQMLTDISLGRGAQLPLNVGLCDSRDPSVKIIKPLRLHDIKELALYNVFNDLTPIVFKQTTKSQYSSVQNLTKEFVRTLQVNYPSTVNTIVRTGDKLSLGKNPLKINKCLLCEANVESQSENVTSAESTDFSHWLSTQELNRDVPFEERYKSSVASNLDDPQYCYACSRIESHLIKQ